MIDKKLLKAVVECIIDYGYDEDNLELHITKTKTGYEWKLAPVEGRNTGVTYTSTPEGEKIEIPIPEYDDFVEDMKDSLMLDLVYILSEWEKYLALAPARNRAKKMNETLRKKNPNHYKEAGKKGGEAKRKEAK